MKKKNVMWAVSLFILGTALICLLAQVPNRKDPTRPLNTSDENLVDSITPFSYGPLTVYHKLDVIATVIADTFLLDLQGLNLVLEEGHAINIEKTKLYFTIGVNAAFQRYGNNHVIRDIGAMIYRWALKDSLEKYVSVDLVIHTPEGTLSQKWIHDSSFIANMDTFPGKTFMERVNLITRYVCSVSEFSINQANYPDALFAVGVLLPHRYADKQWMEKKALSILVMTDSWAGPLMDEKHKVLGVALQDENRNTLMYRKNVLHAEVKQ